MSVAVWMCGTVIAHAFPGGRSLHVQGSALEPRVKCMDDFDTPSILAVGAKLANLHRAKSTDDFRQGEAGQVQLVEVDSGKQAFDLLRVLKFDLVAVGPGVNDMAPEQFVRRLQAVRPWQRWALVADEALSDADETIARTLGAIAVLDGPDAWKGVIDLARQVRRRNPASTVPNLSIRSAAV